LQKYIDQNQQLIQTSSDTNEEEKAIQIPLDPPASFFEEKEDYQTSEYNMFSAFSHPNRDFSLFSPVQDSPFGAENQINFNLLNNSSDPMHQEEDEVLGQFSTLQDLRNQSETINYDITTKSFKYR